MGAGIVPVGIKKGEIVFLFGKENKYNSIQGFSDFGGGKEKNETNIQTATREGAEELMGFIGNQNKIKKLLKMGTFSIKENNYEMFLFFFPYDDKLPYYFNNSMSFFENFLPDEEIEKKTCFEKSFIRWMTLNDMIKNKSKFRFFIRKHIDTIKEKKNEIEKFIKSQQTCNA